jgi:hypothetical protein
MMLRPLLPGRILVAVATTGRPSIIVVSRIAREISRRPAVHRIEKLRGAIPGM